MKRLIVLLLVGVFGLTVNLQSQVVSIEYKIDSLKFNYAYDIFEDGKKMDSTLVGVYLTKIYTQVDTVRQDYWDKNKFSDRLSTLNEQIGYENQLILEKAKFYKDSLTNESLKRRVINEIKQNRLANDRYSMERDAIRAVIKEISKYR